MSNNIVLPPSGANAIPVTVVDTPPSGGTAIPVSGYDTYPTDRGIAGALPINVIVIRDADLVENGGAYTLAANQFAVPVFTAPDELGQAIGNTPLAVYPVNGWQPDVPQVVQDPTFSPAAGTYATTQNVTISTTTSGATIRYTTDGSTPSESVGTIYTTPVAISANATLKAIAYKSGWTDSQVVSGAYIIGVAPTFSSAEVGNVNATTVAVTFSENVSASNYASGVTIKVNGSGVTISSATRQSNHALVYYVVTPAVVFGNTVTWEYAQASGNIVGETGGIALANVSAQSVTNNVAFTPAAIPNMKLWLSARQMGLVNNAAVASYTDFSGMGHNCTQATVSLQPVAKTAAINGVDSVLFDASDDTMASASFTTLAQPNTVFAVAKLNTNGNGLRYLLDGNTARNLVRGNSGVWGIYAGSILDSAVAPTTNTTILTAIFNGASSKLRVNGTEVASGDAGSQGIDQFIIGTEGSAILNAHLPELIFYNALLGASDIAAVEAYLNALYAAY